MRRFQPDFCPTMEEACRDSNGGVDFCVDTPAAIVAECIYPRRSNFDDACVTFSGCNITVGWSTHVCIC